MTSLQVRTSEEISRCEKVRRLMAEQGHRYPRKRSVELEKREEKKKRGRPRIYKDEEAKRARKLERDR